MEYVSRVKLEANGKAITDFKTVTIKPREYYKQIKLMNKVGFLSVNPLHAVTVGYVEPESGAEIDWTTIRDGRLTIELENGKRITYTGAYVMTVGEAKFDGENESVTDIDIGATGRVEE